MDPLTKEVWEQLEKALDKLDLRKDEIKILILDVSPHSQISRVPIVSASISKGFSVGVSGLKTISIWTTENI
jgi:myo-inositol catabolism protein IolC